MLKASELKVGDIIAAFDKRTGKPWTANRVVTKFSGPYHPEDGDTTVYISFVKSDDGRLDTGAFSDDGDGIETTFDWEDYRVVGHTDIAGRLADILGRSVNWRGEVA